MATDDGGGEQIPAAVRERRDTALISSPTRMLRISKELRKLQFSNPGEKMKASSSARRARMNMGQLWEGEEGRLEVCDCLNIHCPGCFLPCPKCRSNKCGAVCRTGRSWNYVKEISDSYQ